MTSDNGNKIGWLVVACFVLFFAMFYYIMQYTHTRNALKTVCEFIGKMSDQVQETTDAGITCAEQDAYPKR